jgi:tetratricopeptide (TPR) repeat protein
MPGSEEMTTTPDRWQRLQQLFHEALARPEAGRHAWIDAACADDLALRDELRRLLAAEAHAEADIQHAIGDAAAQLVRAGRHERVGTRLGPWRLVAHHADGGMGAVYRAVRDDGRYDQQVAVKLLNPASDGAAAKARLEAERRILARLEHPHIARLLDGGSTNDGVPYLVMEFVDGQPIDAWCDIHGADTAMRLRLFVQVCRAVDHAHRNLVVHRDLKPSNILVDGEGRPRLLDFGIAKLVDEGSALTRTGERAFTPSHASPEQVTGGVVTTATDVFALGVLLYDLLAGKLPYGGAETPAPMLARRIVETEPPRPSTAVASDDSRRRLAAAGERGERLTPQRLARELAGDLDNIVLMALRKEPERRYASVAALADDVERYLADLPVRARPATLGYRAAKFLRRHPVAVPASALALVLATGAAGTFTWRLAAERDRALAAEARATRVAAFTASVLRNTGADEGATREVPVQTLLEGAVKRVDDELASEPEVATRLRIALGDAIMSWGEYEKARLQFEAALATARTRGAIGERDAAEAMQLLGVATHELGQLERSLDWSRQAEVLFRRAGSVAEHASALGDVAMSLNALRRREEAEPVFREAIARLRQAHAGADHDDIAWMLNNLAWNLHARGRLDEAEPLYTEALAMQRRIDAPLTTRSQTQNNLAGIYYDRGRLDEAERLWREVLQQYEQVFGADGHAAVARAQAMVALVDIERGRWDEAVLRMESAVATNQRLLGERHRWTAGTLVRLGMALLGAGRLDEAEHRLRQAVAIEREVLPPVHASHAHTRLALARLALARSSPQGPARAERLLREALEQIAALPSPDRVPIDSIDLELARTLALQGQVEAGRTIFAAAIQRMRDKLPERHWRRLAAEAAFALPPWVEQPTVPERDRARQALAELRELTGTQAQAVRQLEQALARLP